MDCFLFLACRVGRRKRQANYEETYPHTVPVDRGPWVAFFVPPTPLKRVAMIGKAFIIHSCVVISVGQMRKNPRMGRGTAALWDMALGGQSPEPNDVRA